VEFEEIIMIKVKKEGIILEKRDLEFERAGVLNPAIMKEGDSVHIFYRAVSEGNHSTLGYARLDGPLHLAERLDTPVFVPETEYETHGVEDARLAIEQHEHHRRQPGALRRR